MREAPAVSLEGVTVRFAGTAALRGVTLQIPPGGFTGVIGPNGAGKTTLLRVAAGTLAPQAGRVTVGGRDVALLKPRERARLMATVPQVEGPPAGFTAEEAVLMGRTPYLRRVGPVGEGDRRRVEDAMRRTSVWALRERLVETLSGGERQRVLIARALAQNAAVLLLDEPTAHLDIAVQLEIMTLLRALNAGGLTLVAALHDLNLAAAYCGTLVLLQRGAVAAVGAPEAVVTATALRAVYETEVLVRPHPGTGRPHVTVLGRRLPLDEGIPWASMPEKAPRRPIIAIDGPMGSGKSTVARGVARALGFRYINTGWMYRAVAREALRRGISLDDAGALAAVARTLGFDFRDTPEGARLYAGGEDVTDALGTPEVSEAASQVSAHPPVRETLVALQRDLGAAGGVVMEGRDIGTVVFPDAEVKVFLQASPEERARRRFNELRQKGSTVTFEELRAAEAERDRRDRERTHSPLRAAADAVVVDSTGKAAPEVIETVIALCRSRVHVG